MVKGITLSWARQNDLVLISDIYFASLKGKQYGNIENYITRSCVMCAFIEILLVDLIPKDWMDWTCRKLREDEK
jgi:hypothetical protein